MTRWHGLILGIACLILFAPCAMGDEDDPFDHAIASGLAYLARQQNADGSFGSDGSPVVDTGASLLAFLSSGNTFEGGRYAGNIRRATEFLVRQLPADRTSESPGWARSTARAIATLALCEAYGVEPDETMRLRIREVAQNALASLETSKADDAWRSAAFRSAERIGLHVPKAPATSPSTAKARLLDSTPGQFEKLLASQLPDGSWPAPLPGPNSRIRATASAVAQLSGKWSLMPAE